MTGSIIIAHAVSQTWVIIGVLLAALISFSRPIRYGELLSIEATQELKGVAILAVLFGHVGLFLVNDHRFLFPLSTCSGVGVNIFLFLSGYGLTFGMLKKPLSVPAFYRKRALKIFIPFWIALIGFIVLDAIALNRTYSPTYILQSLLGFFPRADMNADINSVFWYITWILGYYLLFPAVFMRQRVWLSALILFALGEGLVLWSPSLVEDVIHLYEVHTAAFPLGMLTASLLFEVRGRRNAIAEALRVRRARLNGVRYYAVIFLLAAIVLYSAYDSGVGENTLKEQIMSMVTTLSLVALFTVKRIEFRALTLVGIFSYEIYLFHWPLLSRYDVIYHALPAAAATFANLGVLIAVGWMIQHLAASIASGRQSNQGKRQ